MERTTVSIRAALAAIDTQYDEALEFGRVAAELRRGVAVISGGQIGAAGRIGSKLRPGKPLPRLLSRQVLDELATYSATNRAVSDTCNAAIAHGESVSEYRTLIAGSDNATQQADYADTLRRHLRPTATGRLLAIIVPSRRRYRATPAETTVMQNALRALANRRRNEATAATETLDPTGTVRLEKHSD
jgi:hypothetical protein